MKRGQAHAQQKLLAPRPVFDRRHRAAMAAVRAAGYWSGHRHWDTGADLLQVRMGLQLSNRANRWGYQVSNPPYYEMLLRNPAMDDGEPGPAWLRRVYTLHPHRLPLTLASARAHLEERQREHMRRCPEAFGLRRAVETPPPAVPAQPDLFA